MPIISKFEKIVNQLYCLHGNNKCKFEHFQIFSKKILQTGESAKIFHVAGTNGKGSVCAMLESIYRAAGYRVGLFTSPHLLNIRERIQVNRSYIPEQDFCKLYQEIAQMADIFGYQLSFFQYLTLIALKYFQASGVDIIVMECGIGGRFDSTNIIYADACIITSIAFDHEEILGNSLEEITYEKAGIIKQGSRVFVGYLPRAIRNIIEQVSRSKQAKLYCTSYSANNNLIIDFQKKNSELACTVVHNMRDILPVVEGKIEYGLSRVFWPVRNQQVKLHNGNIIIFDGGHNTEAAEIQRRYVQENFGGIQSCLIFSSTKPKHAKNGLEIYMPYFTESILCNISDAYKKQDDKIFQNLADKYGTKCQFLSIIDIVQILSVPSQKKFFITGSLYFIGEIIQSMIDVGQLSENAFTAPAEIT